MPKKGVCQKGVLYLAQRMGLAVQRLKSSAKSKPEHFRTITRLPDHNKTENLQDVLDDFATESGEWPHLLGEALEHLEHERSERGTNAFIPERRL